MALRWCKDVIIKDNETKESINKYINELIGHLITALTMAREEMTDWHLLTHATKKLIWQSYDHLLNVNKTIFMASDKTENRCEI